MGGIPDEKAGILASATIFSWVADPESCPKSELRLAPVELVRLLRNSLMEALSKKIHLLLFPGIFCRPLFSSPNLDVSP
jgi:hypothetical protein